ncbi:hypothetical protein ACFLYO_07410 [Chloroflexota bacterium]
MSDLPAFQKPPYNFVHDYATRVLAHPGSEENYLRDLIAYDDGHYRAIFDPAYFVLAEGRTEPSKSQWNTLKKKMKRHHRGVFVFKQHGTTEYADAPHYTIDFGFFAD